MISLILQPFSRLSYFAYRNFITFVAQHTLTKQISYRVTSEFQQLDAGHFPVSYTLIQTKLFDFYTLSQTRLPENHTLHSSAYPYSLCMVVPQRSIKGTYKSSIGAVGLCAVLSRLRAKNSDTKSERLLENWCS